MKGISFDDIHSYEDLNLVLSKVVIPPAQPKETYIDIPNGNGSVDLTEALGEVKYKDREATITFTVFPEDNFEQKKTQVSNLLNGVRFEKIILDKDPDYYWSGRCKVNEYASDRNLHKIVVKATLAPYKMKVNETVVQIPAGNEVRTVLENGRKTVIPTLQSTTNFVVKIGEKIYNYNGGTHRDLDIALKFGENPIVTTSTNTVTVTYREGDL